MVHTGDLEERYDLPNAMARVTLNGIFDDNINKVKHPKKVETSTNQSSYQPMAAGIRTTLWQEGYEYREYRRKNGFNHTKLEWIVPTDRSIGKSKFRGDTPKNSKDEQNLEPLSLSPTKLQKKREKLRKIYEKKRLKEREKKDAIPSKKDDEEKDSKLVVEAKSLVVPKSLQSGSKMKFLTDYEKNKLFNLQSNIELPTCSTAGSLASRSGGRNLYGYKCYFSPTKTNSPKKRTSGYNGQNKSNKSNQKDTGENYYPSHYATKGSGDHDRC